MFKKDKEKKAKGNVFLLGITSFLNDIGGEMIAPILPLFIASLGGSGLVIGVIAGFREAISSILQIFAGYWSDKIGKRKIFVEWGYLLSGFSKLILPFATVWHSALIFAGFERVGKGIRTAPRDAIVAETMPHDKGWAFGVHRAFDTCGAIVGVIIVFFLLWYAGLSFNAIFIFAAAICFLSLIPLYYVTDVVSKPKDCNFISKLKIVPKPVWLFVLVAGLFSLANFGYMFTILKAQIVSNSITIPILLYLLFNVFYALYSVPAGRLSDKLGRKNLLFCGYVLFFIVSLGFAFSGSLYWLSLFFALFGIVYAIVEVNQRAMVADLADKDAEGTSIGLYHAVVGVVALPAGLIAGLLWDFSISATFLFGAVISIVVIFVFATLCYKKAFIVAR